MTFFKGILIVLGTISLILAVAGVFIPGLPTTPFVLLSAGLYIRSSEKLYNTLISNRFFGSYILKFQSDRGMTRRQKYFSIGTMWIMITLSYVFFISNLSFKILVLVVGIIGTIVMGFIIPTVQKDKDDS